MKYINKLKDTIIGILILIMMIFVVAMAYKPFVEYRSKYSDFKY